MVKLIGNSQEFNTLLESNALVVVDFFAEWCGPCKNFAPAFELKSKTRTNVVFCKIDVDNDSCGETCEKYNITCMPTFLFFKNGNLVDRLEGASESSFDTKLSNLVE